MPFAAALATGPDPIAAAGELCAAVRGRSAGIPDLVFVFFSPHHLGAAADIGRAIRAALQLDGSACLAFAQLHTWERCTRQFIGHLAPLAPRTFPARARGSAAVPGLRKG